MANGRALRPPVFKVPIGGGPLTLIAPTSDRAAGAAWRADGIIVFATSEGLFQVSANGGGVKRLIKPDRLRKEGMYAWPQFLPGGQALLFTIVSTEPGVPPQIARLDLATLTTSTRLTSRGAARTTCRPGTWSTRRGRRSRRSRSMPQRVWCAATRDDSRRRDHNSRRQRRGVVCDFGQRDIALRPLFPQRPFND
jgi:hypothetical protein